MKTPYENHVELEHGPMTRHSPNGIDIIEECDECGARFMHTPSLDYPITMPHILNANRSVTSVTKE